MDFSLDDKLAHMRTWILSDGKAGHINQSLGIAEALGLPEPEVFAVTPRRGGGFLGFFNPALAVKKLPKAPWPDVLIATGSTTAPTAWWVKMNHPETFVIQMMRPPVGEHIFDVVAVPLHDRPAPAENLVVTTGAPNRITEEKLEEARTVWEKPLGSLPTPRLAVLIGGASKKTSFNEAQAATFAHTLVSFAKKGGYSLLMTASRRTGAAQAGGIRKIVEESGLPHYFWDGEGENPYMGLLAHAEAAVVTADSVSMVSEACSAGLPVYVHGLEDNKNLGKFRRFYQALAAQGWVAPLTETETFLPRPEIPLADTQKVAGFARGLLTRRLIDA